ncbi:PIN domain-containing protein [Candidatus Woesearchaeota archaeon]|nr:PIN domain-containing protein [Candidatus Woesearchaeota archaeon]
MIIDSSAWIEYLTDAACASAVEQYLAKEDCTTLSVTLAEVLAKTLKIGGNPNLIHRAIKNLSLIEPVSEQLSVESASIYFERRKTHHKFTLSDAFILAFARMNHVKILTKDTDFAGLKEAVIVH